MTSVQHLGRVGIGLACLLPLSLVAGCGGDSGPPKLSATDANSQVAKNLVERIAEIKKVASSSTTQASNELAILKESFEGDAYSNFGPKQGTVDEIHAELDKLISLSKSNGSKKEILAGLDQMETKAKSLTAP
ncbi:hypothetical protein Pan216_13530 [Planctomycetes bacterium Pan216]|uniref:Cytochrome b562 n=1 Tax=Kolteria novifilia TaxID=2527975 RepID=A0A518B0P5_9BACT|nr:hypothetical protein Pan216_13530 [Planctomycetes bacterium Pan216]